MHKQKRQHFHAKTTSEKLYISIGVGSRDLCMDEAHTVLDIFRFAVFFSWVIRGSFLSASVKLFKVGKGSFLS